MPDTNTDPGKTDTSPQASSAPTAPADASAAKEVQQNPVSGSAPSIATQTDGKGETSTDSGNNQKQAEALMDALIKQTASVGKELPVSSGENQAPLPSEPPPQSTQVDNYVVNQPSDKKPKKRTGKVIGLVTLLLLLISLPIGVYYFVNNGGIGDIRSKAAVISCSCYPLDTNVCTGVSFTVCNLQSDGQGNTYSGCTSDSYPNRCIICSGTKNCSPEEQPTPRPTKACTSTDQCCPPETMCQGEGAQQTGYLCSCVLGANNTYVWQCNNYNPTQCPIGNPPPVTNQLTCPTYNALIDGSRRCITALPGKVVSVINKYSCPGMYEETQAGCQLNVQTFRSVTSSTSVCLDDGYCGTQQIDAGDGCFVSATNICSSPTSRPNPTATPIRNPTATPVRSPTPTIVPTQTPTPIIAQCSDLMFYQDGVAVDPSTLQSGDTMTIAVVGVNATKARIRVNGKGLDCVSTTWTETSEKDLSGRYIADFTLCPDTTTFTIEAEVYRDGVWQ